MSGPDGFLYRVDIPAVGGMQYELALTSTWATEVVGSILLYSPYRLFSQVNATGSLFPNELLTWEHRGCYCFLRDPGRSA